MKTKPLAVIIALLIVIIFFVILIRESSKVLIAPEFVPPEDLVAEEESSQLDMAPRVAAAPSKRAAITIIKPIAKEKTENTGIQAEKGKEKRIVSFDEGDNAAYAGDEQGPGAEDTQAEAGITKIGGKKPSVEERNEMNARGIIMF